MIDSSTDEFTGLLFIGDPHLASREPGFRKDNYARTVLSKIRWTIDYAKAERLLPVMLGDLFHNARDNMIWMLVDLLVLLGACPGGRLCGIYGNHDCKENQVGDHDTLSILLTAGHLRLLDRAPWTGRMNGCHVVVGGTSYGQALPKSFDRAGLPSSEPSRVFWVTHHDLRFSGYDDGRIECRAIPGIDVIVNGHIHRPLPDVVAGDTTWINPGNITRVSRGGASRDRQPAVLRIDLAADGAWSRRMVPVPHEAFDDVFHPEVEVPAELMDASSQFILSVAALESARTASGAGLRQFLDAHLGNFDERVAREINSLAEEVLQNAR